MGKRLKKLNSVEERLIAKKRGKPNKERRKIDVGIPE